MAASAFPVFDLNGDYDLDGSSWQRLCCAILATLPERTWRQTAGSALGMEGDAVRVSILADGTVNAICLAAPTETAVDALLLAAGFDPPTEAPQAARDAQLLILKLAR